MKLPTAAGTLGRQFCWGILGGRYEYLLAHHYISTVQAPSGHPAFLPEGEKYTFYMNFNTASLIMYPMPKHHWYNQFYHGMQQ